MATPAIGPTTWNPLALMSFLLSLVFPAGLLIVQLAGGVFQPVHTSTPSAYQVGVTLLKAGVLTVLLAIFAGHGALDRARRRAYRWPLRTLAFVSLALGYGAVVAYLVGIVLFYWGVSHQRWHLVG